MRNLSQIIDHTLLKAQAIPNEIEALCKEALQYQFGAVCVNGRFVKLAADVLKGSSIKVVAVVGFPLGTQTSAVKAFEAEEAIRNGASEIDMVLSLGDLKTKNEAAVYNDISTVVSASSRKPVKVILETCFLSDDEKILGCKIAEAAGCTFVKTSTGFGSAGATVEDVKLLRKSVSEKVLVKASGGIRTYKDAMAMIEAGASRLGTSQSISILIEATRGSPTGGGKDGKSGKKEDKGY